MASSYTTAAAAVASAVLLLCLSGISAAAEPAAAAAVTSSDVAYSKMDLSGLKAPSYRHILQEMATLTDKSIGARRLLGADQFVTLRPKCEWTTDDGEPWCYPLLDNWLQYSGTPSSPYRRATLMATQRSTYCYQTHKDRASCHADQANRCYWWKSQDGRKAECGSADAAEVLYYGEKNFTASPFTIPAALTCPGTKAYEFYSCFARPDAQVADDCKQLPNCYPATLDGSSKTCLPKWMKGYSADQFEEVWRGLEDLKPELYGNCAGACWIRQAKLCLTKAARPGCDAVPFCSWDPAASACAHKTMEFANEYDFRVGRLYGMCLQADNQKDCEAHKKGSSSKVQNEAAAVFRKYKPSAEPVKCKLA